MLGEPGPETLIGEQPTRRHRDQPVLVAGRIDGDHGHQMVIGDHPGARHPCPRRAALPGRRRRHVEVQSALPQLPQRRQRRQPARRRETCPDRPLVGPSAIYQRKCGWLDGLREDQEGGRDRIGTR
jgi:hypothetical protein